MSPEQVLGETADLRSDIYSAAVILYELLSGQRPFEGAAASIMHKIVHVPPPLPSTLPAAVPARFDAILNRALAKAPDERFQSAADFAGALRDIRVEETTSPPTATTAARTDAEDDQTVMAPPPAAVSLAAAPPRAVAASAVDPGATKPAVLAPQPRTVAPAPAAPVQPVRPDRFSPAALGALLAVILLAGAGGGYVLLAGTDTSKPAVPAPLPAPQNPSSGSPTPKPPVAGGTDTPPARPEVPKPLNPPVGPAKPPAPQVADKPPPTGPLDPAAELRAAIAPMVSSMPCSLIRADFPGGQALTLTGWTSLGETADILAEGTLRGTLAKVPGLATVDAHIRRIDGPFCSVLDAIRPVFGAPPDNAFAIAVAGDPTRLNDGATMRLRATMPPFAATLRVDRFAADGSVVHLLAPPASASPMDPGSVVPLGAGAGTISAWMVTTADGPSVVVAVASSLPLPFGQRPTRESASAYLADLAPALKDAQSRGRVSTAVTIVGAGVP
jgi:serine/threonine-protein kinase